jgi:hypothetical protein
MKQNQISQLLKLDVESYENIFNVYQDDNGMYYYNLLQTISFPSNLPLSLFTSYVVKYGDSWPFISYKNFNTPNLWWLILLANNIQNPLEPLVNGTVLKIPKTEVVKEVLAQIGK